MISAKEAAAIPSAAITEIILSRIERKIRQAREDNEYTCWFTFNMNEETQVSEILGILKSLGYGVMNCTKSGFSNTTTLKIYFMHPTTDGDNHE